MTSDELVAALIRGRSTHHQELSVEFGGLDAAEALRTQLEVADRVLGSGGRIGGWKAGFTSGDNRDRLGATMRPFGFFPDEQILGSGQDVVLDDLNDPQLEAEVCLILGEALTGDVSYDQARAAVRSVAAAFEVTSRRVPPDHPDRQTMEMADGMNGWAIIVGEEIPVADLSAAMGVRLARDGQTVTHTTFGDANLTDPFLSLVHMASTLATYGTGLAAGQRIITGAIAKAPATPGRWTADFEDLGQVAVSFR